MSHIVYVLCDFADFFFLIQRQKNQEISLSERNFFLGVQADYIGLINKIRKVVD